MPSKEEVKSIIKDLARRGEWVKLEAQFGASKTAKARQWMAKKSGSASKSSKKAVADEGATPNKPSAGTTIAKTHSSAASAPVSTHVEKSKPTDGGQVVARRLFTGPEDTKDPKPALKVKKTSSKKHRSKLPSVSGGRKKPMGAYMLFTKDARSRLRDEHPDASITDLAKLMGAEWREMTDEDKEMYRGTAAELKAKYDAAVAAEGGAAGTGAVAGGKRKRDSGSKGVSIKKRKKSSTKSAQASVEVVKVHPNGLKEFSDGRIVDDDGNPHFPSEVDAKPRVETEPDLKKFQLRTGIDVVIVLPALEDFLASAAGVASDSTLEHVTDEDVESFPSLRPNGILEAKCTKLESAEDGSWKLATFEFPAQAGDSSGGAAASGAGSNGTSTMVLPWLDASDKSMGFVPYVLTKTAFEASVQDDVRPGSQVSADFVEASPSASDSSDSTDEEKWVMYEGRVYHVGNCTEGTSKRYKNCPFRSLCVVWYYQSISQDRWVLDEQQLDNLMSPWDVQLSSEFVRPQNVHAYADVPVPTLGEADHVVAYMRRCEFGEFFWEDPTSDDSDYASRIRHPMCLRTMLRRHRQGYYAGSKSNKIWEDLLLMVKNAKKYYDSNRLEYRMADMLYREIKSIKKNYKPGQGSIAAARAAVPRVNPRAREPGTKPKRREVDSDDESETSSRRKAKKVKAAAALPPTQLRSKRGSAAEAVLRLKAKALQEQGFTAEEASASSSLTAAQEDDEKDEAGSIEGPAAGSGGGGEVQAASSSSSADASGPSPSVAMESDGEGDSEGSMSSGGSLGN